MRARSWLAFSIVMNLSTSSVSATTLPEPERIVLDSGVRLLVLPQRHLPMVVVNVQIDAGSRFDPAGKEGLAGLTAELLTQGTSNRSAPQIHDEIDYLGARLGAGAGDDVAQASLTVLTKDLAAGLDLLADVVLRPTFLDDDVERKRAETLAALEAEEQDPGDVASRAFRKQLFQSGPYRHGSVGWKESVEAIEPADIRAFHAAAYRPDRTIIAIAGDLDRDQAVAAITKAFGGWPTGEGALAPPPVALSAKPEILRIERDLTQANIIWGHRGTTRSDPDWYAIQVMNYVFGGGGFSSRIMDAIRTDAGLAYSVYSYFTGNLETGSFQAGLQTKAESTHEALALLRREIDRIRTEPLSEQELDDAKRYLTGSFPLRFDSNADLVQFYSQAEFYGLGLDYPKRYPALIESITAADVLRVAKEYLRPDERILVVVGKQASIDLGD